MTEFTDNEDRRYIRRYTDDVHKLLEKKTAGILDFVQLKTDTGAEEYFDRVGSLEAQEASARKDESFVGQNVYRDRRYTVLEDWEIPFVISWRDDIRSSLDQKPIIKERMASAMGRRLEKTIIDAALGNALQATNLASSGSLVALPSSQIVASGSTDITPDKIKDAIKILEDAGVDTDMGLLLLINPYAKNTLVKTNEIINGDFTQSFNQADGKLKNFHNVEFRVTNMIPSSATDAGMLLMAKGAVGLRAPKMFDLHMSLSPKKNVQMYACSSFGATRVEDELVVRINCDQP